MKKLKIEKTKPTFIVKTFKVVYYGCIVYSNSNSFINKIIMQIIGVSFSSSNSALGDKWKKIIEFGKKS